jgi:hypothetical protein
MKLTTFTLAMWIWCAAGCAWLRPPEPTGNSYSTSSPATVSPVSGLPTEPVSADRNRAFNRAVEDLGGRTRR